MKLLPGSSITGSTVGTMAVGAGVVLLAPVVVPIVASVMKPMVKAVFKGGILAYENARIAVAETKETIEDIAAEARSEISAGQTQAAKTGAKKTTK
ncbi:MAG: DUF5132 domain-containing protein [Desulfobacterales bacterium]|jgi:hypothetical protein